MHHFHLLIRLVQVALLCLACGAANAQPAQRPMTMVVPYPPGGPTDLVGRLVASNLAAQSGQSVIVENRAGAGGYVGSEYASRAAPDGSVLLFTAAPNLHSHLFVKGQSTILPRALVPIAGIGEAPYVLVAPANLPTKSLAEFIAHVKASPAKLNAASIAGGAQILDTVTFLKRAGMDMVIIPYNDGQGPMLSLLRGENQLFIGTLTVAKPHIESRKVAALAMTGGSRFFLAPDIPTATEQGVKFETGIYTAVFGPARLPPALVGQFSKRILSSMDSNAAREALKKLGFEPMSGTVEELAARFRRDEEDLTSAAATAGIQPQ